jgi:hypothetical protein
MPPKITDQYYRFQKQKSGLIPFFSFQMFTFAGHYITIGPRAQKSCFNKLQNAPQQLQINTAFKSKKSSLKGQ